MTPEEQQCREAVISEDYQELIINYSGRRELLQRAPMDCYQLVNDDFAISYAYRPFINPTDAIGSYSQMPKCYGLMQLENLEEIGVTRVRRIENFDLYGQGVIIGIVDTGVDYSHPAFLQADGTSRIAIIWDQNDQNGEPPTGFLYGTEYGREEITAGIAPKDEIGHGTFLAGVAAGKEDFSNNFAGVASQSELAVVKLRQIKTYLRRYYLIPEYIPAYSEADIMLAVRFLNEYSRKRNLPLVLILGVGTNAGGHTGSLPLCRYLDSMAYHLNLCMITSAGNEGNARHHYSNTASRELQEVELQVGKEPRGFTMELWTQPVSRLRFSLVSPFGERAELSKDALQYEQRITFVFDRTVAYIRSEPQERNSSRQLLMIRLLSPSSGAWRILVDGAEEQEGDYDIWLPIRDFITEDTFFPVADPNVTICEPGNANLIITTGGYSSVSGGFFAASGRGFTANGNSKPTLVAPAVNVVGPYLGGGYTTMSGTSIAAAYTAGCVALIWEFINSYREELSTGENPEWLGEQLYLDTTIIKNLLTLGATRNENRSYPNRETGFGGLNLFGVFEKL